MGILLNCVGGFFCLVLPANKQSPYVLKWCIVQLVIKQWSWSFFVILSFPHVSCMVKQGDAFASTLLFCIQQTEARNISNQEANAALWRPASRVPAFAHSASVWLHFSLLPPPGKQQENLSEDRKMEWAGSHMHSKWVVKKKRNTHLLGVGACMHLR